MLRHGEDTTEVFFIPQRIAIQVSVTAGLLTDVELTGIVDNSKGEKPPAGEAGLALAVAPKTMIADVQELGIVMEIHLEIVLITRGVKVLDTEITVIFPTTMIMSDMSLHRPRAVRTAC